MSKRGLGLLGAALLVCAAATSNGAAGAAEPPGGRVWMATFSGAGHRDEAVASVASPDGARLFMTGVSGHNEGTHYGTVAVNAATGARLWSAVYGATPTSRDEATAIAVSPDGAKVFVTGRSSSGSYATVAYDAATGVRLWATLHAGDEAAAIVVSPDGKKVFTAGTGRGATVRKDMSTVAYDTTTGAKLWTVAYNGPANLDDRARSIAISPNGSRVLVTGTATNAQRGDEYLTLAYRTSDGARYWFARYNHLPGSSPDAAVRVALSHDGAVAVVTGSSQDAASPRDVEYATVAYDALTGAQLWVSRVEHESFRYATDLVISPDDSRIYVTGTRAGVPGERYTTGDYLTVALDAASGAEVWEARYNGTASVWDDSRAMALSEDGTQLVVTGSSSGGFVSHFDLVTVAYDAASGTEQWVARLRPDLWAPDAGNDVVVIPGRGQVATTGYTTASLQAQPDYLMVTHAL